MSKTWEKGRKINGDDAYTTICREVSAEINEKKSRFIAVAAPVPGEGEALAFLEAVRAQHRMARHNVFAYVLRGEAGVVGGGERVRYSDDGEPARTAGLPVLEVVRHAGLSNVIVVVTRYFGGTLLGTGGLVRAYTQAAQAALAQAELVTMVMCVDVELRVPYADYERVLRVAQLGGAKLLASDFGELVCLRLRVRAQQWVGAGEQGDDAGEQGLQGKLVELLRTTSGLAASEPFIAEI